MEAPTPATDEVFALGEGPVWDAARGRLLWVDILGRAVYEGMLDEARLEVTGRHEFDQLVGAVTVAVDGTLLVAAQEQLVIIRTDGSREQGPRVVPAGQRRRCNDGSTDPAGRLVIGTLSLDGPSEREVLVRLESDTSLAVLDDDLTLSNGLAWSRDGARMYSVDTLRQVVFARDYDPATGEVGERWAHVEVGNGFPDGIALDADEHLWVAIWGAGQVRRYDRNGIEVDRVAVPAPHTSSVAFAGDDLHTLVITTATAELDASQRADNPDSGRVFTLRSDVPGLSVPPWCGT